MLELRRFLEEQQGETRTEEELKLLLDRHEPDPTLRYSGISCSCLCSCSHKNFWMDALKVTVLVMPHLKLPRFIS